MEDSEFIDFQEGQKFLAADHLLFLKRFYEVDLEASINAVKTAYAIKNWEELKRAAHSLKGTSSYIGAVTCKKLSEALQMLSAEAPCSEEKIQKGTNDLLAHLEGLKAYLRSHFTPALCEKSSQSDVINQASRKPEEMKMQQKEETKEIIKLVPPVSRVSVIESPLLDDEEELDAYDEINKQWRCILA